MNRQIRLGFVMPKMSLWNHFSCDHGKGWSFQNYLYELITVLNLTFCTYFAIVVKTIMFGIENNILFGVMSDAFAFVFSLQLICNSNTGAFKF